MALQWRHNGHDGVSNHQPHDCLLNRFVRRRSKNTSKLRVTDLCEGNSLVTSEFPAQRASNAENVSNWWRHHDLEPLPQYWPFVVGCEPVDSYHKGPELQSIDISLLVAWTSYWTNSSRWPVIWDAMTLMWRPCNDFTLHINRCAVAETRLLSVPEKMIDRKANMAPARMMLFMFGEDILIYLEYRI